MFKLSSSTINDTRSQKETTPSSSTVSLSLDTHVKDEDKGIGGRSPVETVEPQPIHERWREQNRRK